MDQNAYYEYQILEHLENSPFITHRMASSKLGVSVKLTHTLMRKMIQRGWVHATRRDGRSLFYFLTPKGIAEKVRLTYEFLDFSRQFYKQARKLSSEICQDLAIKGNKQVAMLGTGDLAEIVYLGINEHGLRLTNVFDPDQAGENFMGLAIQPLDALPLPTKGRFSKILVALYDPGQPMRGHYLPQGITEDKRFVWVFDHASMIERIEESAPAIPENRSLVLDGQTGEGQTRGKGT